MEGSTLSGEGFKALLRLDEMADDVEEETSPEVLLAVIEQFGRYPHRNDMLGRQSTPEELEFLRQPGSRF